MRPAAAALVLAAGLGLGVAAAAPGDVGEEPPALAARVATGELPPLARRLPERPLVVPTDPEAGHGGELRMLIGTPKDVKLAFVYYWQNGHR